MRLNKSTYESERRVLTEFVQQCPGTYVVEVGAYHGTTTVDLAAAAQECGKIVVVIDPWNGYYSAGEQVYQSFLRTIEPWKDIVTVIRRKSDEALLPDEMLEECSLVFIDGDHAGEAPYHDFVKYWPYVAPGGVLAIHDYFDQTHGPSVSAAVDRFVFGHLPPPQDVYVMRSYPTPYERRRHGAKNPSYVAGIAWIFKDGDK